MNVIYLDNNATTRPLDAVVDAMLPYLHDAYANPSSLHFFGQSARHQLELAREQTAALINAAPREIVFTSGGTESINLAIKGVLEHAGDRRQPPRIITSTVEHSAVHNLCKHLADAGVEIANVAVDGDGRLDTAILESALATGATLVSLMHANNETGVLFDIDRVAALCADRGVPLHLDAVQSAGKVPINLAEAPISLVSLSAHKMHGPKGAGALYVRRRTRLAPQIIGGSQERQLRAGTENVAAIVGMGVAAQAAATRLANPADHVRRLRDRLENGIRSVFPTARVNGAAAPRICNTTNIAFPGLQAEAILILLSENGICASAGSACSSGSLEPSHVLQAMGIDPHVAHGAIRFSLSHFTTDREIDHVVASAPTILRPLTRLASPTA